MKKLLEENETLTQIVNNAGHPPGWFHQSISRNFLRKIRLKTITTLHTILRFKIHNMCLTQ